MSDLRATWWGGAILAAIALVMVLYAVPASAMKVHPFVKEVELKNPGGFSTTPSGIAINRSTQHLYVSVGRGVVFNYAQDGTLDPIHPRLTGATGERPLSVAVDNSGAATEGYIYTTELSEGIRQYDANGSATGIHITAASIPSNGTPQGGGLPNVVNSGEFRPRYVAVGPSADIFAQDDLHQGLIDEFTPAGSFVAQYPYGQKVKNGFVGELQIGSAGQFEFAGAGAIYRLGASGECLDGTEEGTELCKPIAAPGADEGFHGLSLAPSGRFLAVRRHNGSPKLPMLLEFDSSGAVVSRIGKEELIEPEGAVLDQSSDQVFATDTNSPGAAGQGRLLIFGPTVVLPDTVTGPAKNLNDHAATLSGTISAAGGAVATCAFEYVGVAEFEKSKFQTAKEVACSTGPFTGEAVQEVEASIAGLTGGATYVYRLVGTNEHGANPAEAQEFTTLGPSVVAESVKAITASTATLEAILNPNGADTHYAFQYVDQASYEADRGSGGDGFGAAAEAPLGGAGAGAGASPVGVAVSLSGLLSSTTYHFRVVAENVNGISDGPDQAFRTYATQTIGLPDMRAYEQASPIDKNGANINGEVNAVQAVPGGDGITFFSGLGIPGGEGAQNFPAYLATRASDSSGWTSTGLLPPASSGPYGSILGWSTDLLNIYSVNKQVGSPETFYVRSGSGPLQQIAEGEGSKRGQFDYAASSEAGKEVLFDANGAQLAVGAALGKTNAYLWDKSTDTVHLAGVLNDGEAPPGGSFSGAYDWYRQKSTEVSSSSNSYFLQEDHAVSDDGSKVFFTVPTTGELYVRVNPLGEPQELDPLQCADPGNQKACTIRVSAPENGVTDPGSPAAFVGATADGGIVYFLDKGQLTQDATSNESFNLYRYELRNAQLTNLTPDTADQEGAGVLGLLGMSVDGTKVYFAANGVLAAGAKPGACKVGVYVGECNVYLAQGGTIKFIARVDTAGSKSDAANWAPTSVRAGNEAREQNTARVSRNGEVLLFQSKANVTSYDSGEHTELYRYIAGGSLSCISCNPTGDPAQGDASLQGFPERVLGPRPTYAFRTRNLSSDGKRILFATPDRLVVGDENAVEDVYEWEADGTGSCASATENGGCLFLISTGSPTAQPSYFGDADETGDNAFFFTSSQLVRQDKDELVDVYDARVGGGIPAQEEEHGEPCKAEGDCLNPPAAAPPATSPGSSTANGANVTPKKPKPCGKGQVRRHGRCVKKEKAHKKTHSHNKKRPGNEGGRGGNR